MRKTPIPALLANGTKVRDAGNVMQSASTTPRADIAYLAAKWHRSRQRAEGQPEAVAARQARQDELEHERMVEQEFARPGGGDVTGGQIGDQVRSNA